MGVSIKILEPVTTDYVELSEVIRMIRFTKSWGPPERRLRNRLLVICSFYFALKPGEIAELRWSDIDDEYKWLRLNRKQKCLYEIPVKIGEELRKLRSLPLVAKQKHVFVPARKTRLINHGSPVGGFQGQSFKELVNNFEVGNAPKITYLPMRGSSLRSVVRFIGANAVCRNISPKMLRKGCIAYLQDREISKSQIDEYASYATSENSGCGSLAGALVDLVEILTHG